MPASTSRLAYDDAYECYDRALKDEFGIRVRFDTEGEALHFRTRLNSARGLDRKENREIYPHGHPMHGVSPYDRIACRIRQVDGSWYVYLLPILGASALEIESLTDFDIPALPKPEPAEYKLTFNGGAEPEPLAELSAKPLVPAPQPTIVVRRR